MKATLLYATFALVLGSPVAFSKSEVETLRDRVSSQEKEIARLSSENARLKGAKEMKPAAEPRAAAAPSEEKAEKADKGATYTVRSGDTLERIARKTGNSAASIGKANNIKPSTIIHPGLVLKLPSASKTATASSPVEKADAKPAVARKTESKPEAKAEAKSEVAKAEPKAEEKSTKVANRTPAASETKTISNPKPSPAPASKSEAKSEALAENAKAPTTGGGGKPVIRSIIIQNETSYGAFASQHGTTADRLNDLNGLSLSTSTVLAKGSELYIPAQP